MTHHYVLLVNARIAAVCHEGCVGVTVVMVAIDGAVGGGTMVVVGIVVVAVRVADVRAVISAKTTTIGLAETPFNMRGLIVNVIVILNEAVLKLVGLVSCGLQMCEETVRCQ